MANLDIRREGDRTYLLMAARAAPDVDAEPDVQLLEEFRRFFRMEMPAWEGEFGLHFEIASPDAGPFAFSELRAYAERGRLVRVWNHHAGPMPIRLLTDQFQYRDRRRPMLTSPVDGGVRAAFQKAMFPHKIIMECEFRLTGRYPRRLPQEWDAPMDQLNAIVRDPVLVDAVSVTGMVILSFRTEQDMALARLIGRPD